MRLTPDELKAAFIYQIGALAGSVSAAGSSLSYIKPHGIIYGMAARDMSIATAISEATAAFGLPLFGMSSTFHEKAAESVGVPFVGEFFADLSSDPSGELIIPRVQSAVDIPRCATRLRKTLEEARVEKTGGTEMPIVFQTICIHSDPPNARAVAAIVRGILDQRA